MSTCDDPEWEQFKRIHAEAYLDDRSTAWMAAQMTEWHQTRLGWPRVYTAVYLRKMRNNPSNRHELGIAVQRLKNETDSAHLALQFQSSYGQESSYGQQSSYQSLYGQGQQSSYQSPYGQQSSSRSPHDQQPQPIPGPASYSQPQFSVPGQATEHYHNEAPMHDQQPPPRPPPTLQSQGVYYRLNSEGNYVPLDPGC